MDVFWRCLIGLLHTLPPESAHDMAICLLERLPRFLIPGVDAYLRPSMARTVSGMYFPHPIGLAAGFDKDARVFDKLGQMGFSFVEVGSVTPLPQTGNPRPRLFRDAHIGAIVNRYGFNSRGAAYAEKRLRSRSPRSVLGINFGKNRAQEDLARDYATLVRRLGSFGDYLVINVSSPNTQDLRRAQNAVSLERILRVLQSNLPEKKPLFVKLGPDLPLGQEREIVDYLLDQRHIVSGLIVTNTTTQRPAAYLPGHAIMQESGGLSGRPLSGLSKAMLSRVAGQCAGRLAVISCGGIETGKDVQERLDMGADLVQIYTSFIYNGPGILRSMLEKIRI